MDDALIFWFTPKVFTHRSFFDEQSKHEKWLPQTSL